MILISVNQRIDDAVTIEPSAWARGCGLGEIVTKTIPLKLIEFNSTAVRRKR